MFSLWLACALQAEPAASSKKKPVPPQAARRRKWRRFVFIRSLRVARTAITDQRIVDLTETSVTVRWKDRAQGNNCRGRNDAMLLCRSESRQVYG
jgi:hypothetical protein